MIYVANIQEYDLVFCPSCLIEDIEGLQSNEKTKQLGDSQSLLFDSLVYLSPGSELSHTYVQQFNRALVYNKSHCLIFHLIVPLIWVK